jgi:hypothetical protein
LLSDIRKLCGHLETQTDLGLLRHRETDSQRVGSLRRPSSNPKDLTATLNGLKAHFKAKGHRLASLTTGSTQRGIVIPAGGRRLLANAFVVIKVKLLSTACDLATY